MWLRVLEFTFGFLFVLVVITQIVWPLLLDAPLWPWLSRRHQPSRHGHAGARKTTVEKIVEGEIVDRHEAPRGDGK